MKSLEDRLTCVMVDLSFSHTIGTGCWLSFTISGADSHTLSVRALVPAYIVYQASPTNFPLPLNSPIVLSTLQSIDQFQRYADSS